MLEYIGGIFLEYQFPLRNAEKSTRIMTDPGPLLQPTPTIHLGRASSVINDKRGA